ncbi:MAG: ABC transporter ATP-binding protein [Candidatus Hodarchaeota archaeon]
MLEIRNITKTFGGLTALHNVDFDINKGDILGLVGPNGAGKSVLVNTITGFYKPDRGSVVFEGEDLVGLRPDEIVERGVIRTFQISTLFFHRSVRENSLLGLQKHAKIGLWEVLIKRSVNRSRQGALEQEAKRLLGFVGLKGFENEIAGKLPYGLQKKLALAIAMGSDPRLLLLDEPLTGLNPAEVDEMMILIGKIHDMGQTMLVIEHDMRAVMRLCNRIVVLNFGEKIAEDTPINIQNNKQVIKVYLGG